MTSPVSSATTSEAEEFAEIQAYADGPPTRMNLRSGAPFGWWPAILIGLVAFIDRAEGAVTLGAAPIIQDYFGFNDAFIGILASAPIIASAILVIPAGKLADSGKRKNILAVVLIIWAFCTLGTGLAVSLAMFTTFRVMLGAATPLNIPPSSSLLGDFYPRRSRTKAFGLLRALENIGLPVGTLVGSVIGGLIGWRVAFVVVALPAIVLSIVLFITLREPRRGVGDEISVLVDGFDLDAAVAAEAAATTPTGATGTAAPARVAGPAAASVIVGREEPPHESLLEELGDPEFGPASFDVAPDASSTKGFFGGFRDAFKVVTVRRLILGQALLYAAFAGYFAFVTTYFARLYFQTEPTFNASGLPYTGGTATAKAGALVAGLSVFAIGAAAVLAARIDARYAKTNPLIRVKASLVALTLGFVALLLFVLVQPFGIALALFLFFAGMNIIAVSNLSAAIADVLPARLRGSGFAAFQSLLAFGGALGAIIVGVGSTLADNNLRIGFAGLLIPLGLGILIVARARKSYVADAEAVLETAAPGDLHLA